MQKKNSSNSLVIKVNSKFSKETNKHMYKYEHSTSTLLCDFIQP